MAQRAGSTLFFRVEVEQKSLRGSIKIFRCMLDYVQVFALFLPLSPSTPG